MLSMSRNVYTLARGTTTEWLQAHCALHTLAHTAMLIYFTSLRWILDQ